MSSTENALPALTMGNLSRHIDQVLDEWSDGFCRLTVDIDDRHSNRDGSVDGGVYAILIDSAAAYAGTFPDTGRPARRCVTVSMTVNYAGRAEGKRLIAEGRVRKMGGRLFFASTEVKDELGNLLAYGDGTFRYFEAAQSGPKDSK